MPTILPIIASVIGIGAGVNSLVGGSNAPNNAAGAAAVADPFAGMRPQFQEMLTRMFPSLINMDPNTIRSNPAFQFLREQGTQAIDNSASSQGLLHSGNRILELSKFSEGLASQFMQQDFTNRMSVATLLARLAGVDASNPAAAGGLLQNGNILGANMQNNGLNLIQGGLSGLNRVNWNSLNPFGGNGSTGGYSSTPGSGP